jgi:predicted metal-dependent hydrolase
VDEAVDAVGNTLDSDLSWLWGEVWTTVWTASGRRCVPRPHLGSCRSRPVGSGNWRELGHKPVVALADYRDAMTSDGTGSATGAGSPPVEVRRSARRRRTVSAYRDGGRIVVLIPAAFSAGQEREWVDRMVARLERGRSRRRSDADLVERAGELSRRYLDGVASPTSVSWVSNQTTRWGSCTTADGTIRLSTRLQPMPEWVVDYVLLHELAHLVEPGHGPAFWALLERYPRTERARGYLEGYSAAG